MKRCIAALTVMFCAAACGGETNNGGGNTNNSTTPTGGGTNVNTTNDNAGNTNGYTPTNGETNTSGTDDAPHNPDAAVGDSCFTNFECNLDQRCFEVGGGESECELGARGTGETGTLCESQNDCASAVCIGRQPDPNICTEECDPDSPACPGDLECVWIPYTGGDEHWCVTPAS